MTTPGPNLVATLYGCFVTCDTPWGEFFTFFLSTWGVGVVWCGEWRHKRHVCHSLTHSPYRRKNAESCDIAGDVVTRSWWK